MGRGNGIKQCWSDTCWKLKNDQYRLCDVCCGWGTTCGCCCACCKNCVISQTSCISSTILMVAWLGMLLSWFFPFHASDHSGPYDCAYEIRLRGGTGDFLYASCKHTPDIIENPPDGATSGYLKEVHYTQKDYDDYIYACITLMVLTMVLSMWTIFTISSDGCCGCCCTGPHRAALLICPNAITIVMGVICTVVYYYGTAPQINHWNENGIVGTLPNNVVIPYVFGHYVDFKWSAGLWLWACSIGLHGVSLIIAVLGLCCWHDLYIPEENWEDENWEGEEGYYEEYYGGKDASDTWDEEGGEGSEMVQF